MTTLRITLVVAMMQMLPGLGWRVSGTLGWIHWGLCVVQDFWRPRTRLSVYPSIKYDQPSAAAGHPHYSWSVFALKVRECGAASVRALSFPLH